MGYILGDNTGGLGGGQQVAIATAATLPVTGASHNVSLMLLVAAITATVMVASRVITRAIASHQAR